jgi:HEAT repeat protein
MTRGLPVAVALTTLTWLGNAATVDAGSFLLKKKADIPKAIALLRSGSAREKAEAADALGERGNVRAKDVQDAIEPLKEALLKEEDSRVRAAAARALGKIAPTPTETVPLLLQALQQDKADEVKAAAIIAISQMPSAAGPAIPEIQKYARDKDKKRKQLTQAARQALKIIRGK